MLLVLGLVAPAHAVDEDRSYFQVPVCSGSRGAWFIVEVGGACGCLTKFYGMDCGGARFAHYFRYEPRTGEVDGTFDYYYSGTQEDGRAWFVKIRLDRDGQFAQAWGQQSDGTFYEALIK